MTEKPLFRGVVIVPADLAQGPLTNAVSVVIPAFNEADNVQPLAEELFRVLAGPAQSEGPEFEVIFIDDGSRDGTADRLHRAGDEQHGERSTAHSSLSNAMRSSSGGCVSNMPDSPLRSPWLSRSGDSIQRCAVALDAECTTVWSSRSFSRAEISPGG